MGWIKARDELPPAQSKVIAFYRNSFGEGRTVMAQYIPPLTVKCCDFYDPDGFDYEPDFNEDDGEEYVTESWHEIIDNWGDYSGCQIVEGEVTHWMPKPLPPNRED